MTVWDNIWFRWFTQNIDSEIWGVDFPDFKGSGGLALQHERM